MGKKMNSFCSESEVMKNLAEKIEKEASRAAGQKDEALEILIGMRESMADMKLAEELMEAQKSIEAEEKGELKSVMTSEELTETLVEVE
jgi:hypothetical protein